LIRLLADCAAHPEGALTWRFKTEWSGSGVLGDLASHGVDLARCVIGEITALACDDATSPWLNRPGAGVWVTLDEFVRTK